jgi:rubrerythrin
VPSRRELVLGGAAAAVVLTGCGDEKAETRAADGLGARDEDVVAFALQLELLERDLYAAIVRRRVLRGDDQRMAERFGATEAEHAETLTAVLRKEGARIPEPIPVDVERLAAGSRTRVLSTLIDIEDLGADAYLGAAPDLLDRDALALALSIHSVEARHAAAVRRMLRRRPAPDGAFASPRPPAQALRRLEQILVARGAA